MTTYYGFNFQWMYHLHLGDKPHPADERALDFMAEHGFNFVRIPANYWFWTTNFDYYHPHEEVLAYLDHYLHACQSRGLHLCLNLHRAPGYCINGAELEKHNLWQDVEAQNAFVFFCGNILPSDTKGSVTNGLVLIWSTNRLKLGNMASLVKTTPSSSGAPRPLFGPLTPAGRWLLMAWRVAI